MGTISTAICCCGKASIEIKRSPLVNAVCHCHNCKKRTGSAFGISVYVKDQQIIKTMGKTTIYKINTNVPQERHFCKNCGTTLYWKVANLPNVTGIAGGCFTDGEILEPNITVANENKCTWLTFPKSWNTSITLAEFQ